MDRPTSPTRADTRAAPVEVSSRVFKVSQILRALSLITSASFASILFSMATTKIIALSVGAEGIALVGLYRNLGAWVAGTLALGYDLIFVQRISNAALDGAPTGEADAAVLLLGLQAACTLTLGTAAAELLARWQFGSVGYESHVGEVRVVLVMALLILVLQTVTAFLKGHGMIGALTQVQVVTAAAGLALIFPLLHFGRLGLALSVAPGALVGTIVGLYCLWKRQRPDGFAFSPTRGWSFLKATAPSSAILCLDSFILLGTFAHIQTVLASGYGLEPLGNYNAALLLVNTSITVLMSAARTYFLPSAGRLQGQNEKNILFSEVLRLSLAGLTAGALALMFLAPILIRVLFTANFTTAPNLLALLAVSFVGQTLGWNFHTLMLHKGDFALTCLLNGVLCVLFVGGTTLCIAKGWSLTSIGWAYATSYTLYGVVYAAFCLHRYGPEVISLGNVRLAGICMGTLLLAYGVSRLASGTLSVAFLAIALAALGLLAFRPNALEAA